MRRNDFYMVLPGNSSMDYYPKNTASKFTTLLPKQVELEGEWAVALSEIQFPCNFLHLVNKRPYYYAITKYTYEDGMEKIDRIYQIDLPEGCFKDITALIEALTSDKEFSEHLKMKYLASQGYVEIEMNCKTKGCDWDDPIAVRFDDKLADMLGFERKLYKLTNKTRSQKGFLPASLSRGLPESLFVYSDICCPYVTGDVIKVN